jgi:hypothetical protein
LDFHILFDAAFSSLDDVRQKRRKGKDGEKLWAGPYVVTQAARLQQADPQSAEWVYRHHLQKLESTVLALKQRDDDKRLRLPSSQMHMLRESLSQGKAMSDSRLSELRKLDKSGLTALVESGDSLFFDDGPERGQTAQAGSEWTTRFLDALSSVDFWPNLTAERQTETNE